VAHPDPSPDPTFPEYEPAAPGGDSDIPGTTEIPDAQPFEGDPYDGRTHD
jgi:hypothetical protein